MDKAHADTITVCGSFLERLTLLHGAMINVMDDSDLDRADTTPQHFRSNDVYRTTFTTAVAKAYDARSWRHCTILSQYRRFLHVSVYDEYSLLHDPPDARFEVTLEWWRGGRDAVAVHGPAGGRYE